MKSNKIHFKALINIFFRSPLAGMTWLEAAEVRQYSIFNFNLFYSTF